MAITDVEKRLTAENLALTECVKSMLSYMKRCAEQEKINLRRLASLCELVEAACNSETTDLTLRQIRYDTLMAYATKLQVSSYNTELGINDYADGYRQASLDIAHDLMRSAHEKMKIE